MEGGLLTRCGSLNVTIHVTLELMDSPSLPNLSTMTDHQTHNKICPALHCTLDPARCCLLKAQYRLNGPQALKRAYCPHSATSSADKAIDRALIAMAYF